MAGKLKSRCFQLRGVAMIMSLTVVCWPVFFQISSSLLEPDLHNSVVFSKTRAPQPCSPSLSAPVAGSSGHGGRQCPARGLHASERLLLFGARDGHAPLLLAVHGAS
jgi:hypothetical protein